MTNLVPLAEVANLKLALPSDDGWVNTMTWVPVSHTELHLCARYYPVVVRLFGGVPTLGLLVSERHLARPLVDASGKWQGAYKPIALRCFPFQVGEIGEDPLKDLLIAPGSQYLRKDAGTAIVGDDGKASPFITEIHRLLRLLQDARRTLAGALDQILIGNLLVPLEDHEAKPKGGQGTTYYTVDRSRFSHIDKPALGAMARQNFLSIDVAVSCLFSQDLLRPKLLSKPSTAASAKAQAFPAARSVHELIGIEDFSLVLDDGELISLTDIRAMRVETQENIAVAGAIASSDVVVGQSEIVAKLTSEHAKGADEMVPIQAPRTLPTGGPIAAASTSAIVETVTVTAEIKPEPEAVRDRRVPDTDDKISQPMSDKAAPGGGEAPRELPAVGYRRSARPAPIDQRRLDKSSPAKLRASDKALQFGRRESRALREVSRDIPSASARQGSPDQAQSGRLMPSIGATPVETARPAAAADQHARSKTSKRVESDVAASGSSSPSTSDAAPAANPKQPEQFSAASVTPSASASTRIDSSANIPNEQNAQTKTIEALSQNPAQATPDTEPTLALAPASRSPSMADSASSPSDVELEQTSSEDAKSPSGKPAPPEKKPPAKEQASDTQPAAEQSQSEPAAKAGKPATAGQAPQDRAKKISPQISDMIRKLNELQALLRLD